MTDVLDTTTTGQQPTTDVGHGDDARRDALVERLFGSLLMGSELMTIELGRRLGLYRSIFAAGSVNSAELAVGAGIAERYAREWLEQQAAAGFLDVTQETGDADTRRFTLPAGHVPVLLRPDHPAYVMGFAPFITGFGLTLPAVAQAYRTGSGVAFERFGDEVRHGIGIGNRPMFASSLRAWLDTLPDITARLRGGGAVLDAGCGTGWSTVTLAKIFDRARISGIDLDPKSVAEARVAAEQEGVADRVQIAEGNAADATDLPVAAGGYDLVTIFEALHDMGDPVSALRAVRTVLAPGGAVLVADERVGDVFTAPAGEVDRLMYACSVLHCLPATMAESQTTANGTVLRASTVRAWAATAGFSTRELPIEHDLWRFYRLDPAAP